MKKLPNIGEWVFITSSHNIGDAKFKESFGERGIFGKVISISDKRYSPFNGKKISPEIMVRAYMRNGRRHLKTRKEYLEIYGNTNNNNR